MIGNSPEKVHLEVKFYFSNETLVNSFIPAIPLVSQTLGPLNNLILLRYSIVLVVNTSLKWLSLFCPTEKFYRTKLFNKKHL